MAGGRPLSIIAVARLDLGWGLALCGPWRHRGTILAGRTLRLPNGWRPTAFPKRAGRSLRRPSGRLESSLASWDYLLTGSGLQAIWWAIACLMFGMFGLWLDSLPEGRSGSGADWSEARWREVVRLRRFWVLVVTSMSSINICWHFLINWLPGLPEAGSRNELSWRAGCGAPCHFWQPMSATWGVGRSRDFLAGRGLEPCRVARVRVMAVCSLLDRLGRSWSGGIPDNRVAIALLGVMALGTAAFMANYFAFCQEVSEKNTGFVVGVLGGVGNLVVAGFLPFAGYVKDATGSFGLVFVLAGLLPFVGLGALVWGWGAETEEILDESAGRIG